MPTLILLGAAGGALRGLLDAYNRFLDWQSDRSAHRRLPAGQEGEASRFQEYFDPLADPIAAVVHSAMGAAAAVLFGTTGQVSGAYAAIVVGISAPVILTQLGRVPSISDVVNGAPQAGTATEEGAVDGSPRAAPPAQRPAPQPPASQPATASPTQPSSTVSAPSESVEERRRPSFTSPDYTSPDFTVGLQTGIAAYDPQPNGQPMDRSDEHNGGLGSHEAPRDPRMPAIDEEGTTR
ncbi:hypothetical protein ABZY09_43470 [Streptomyces sp. NPDC002928]|uniref:hypothetical protein n=1 Tax=Streptomyces sp. NPDC002928 TaxID=3154440 RepID=UPI0033B3AA2D